MGRLGAVQLAVQRETERDPALGHDVADRRMQAGTGEDVGDQILDRSELPFEHAAEAAILVVLFHATDIEEQVPVLCPQIARYRIAALRHGWFRTHGQTERLGR